jgi:hypothetical protein
MAGVSRQAAAAQATARRRSQRSSWTRSRRRHLRPPPPPRRFDRSPGLTAPPISPILTRSAPQELMRDPVTLPVSGQTVDRATIRRILQAVPPPPRRARVLPCAVPPVRGAGVVHRGGGGRAWRVLRRARVWTAEHAPRGPVFAHKDHGGGRGPARGAAGAHRRVARRAALAGRRRRARASVLIVLQDPSLSWSCSGRCVMHRRKRRHRRRLTATHARGHALTRRAWRR